jgi:hypothetical protein
VRAVDGHPAIVEAVKQVGTVAEVRVVLHDSAPFGLRGSASAL